MNHKFKFIIHIMLMVSAFSANASPRDEFCKIKPKDLGTVAMRIRNQSKANGDKGFPETSVFQSDVSMEMGNDFETAVTGTYEAYLRVEKDGNFSVLPIPIANVELMHERNIVYVCTHVEPNKEKSFLEVYFLNGYHLGSISWSSFAGDLLFRSITVSPVPISPIGFESVGNLLEKLGPFPFNLIAVPFDIAGQAQSIIMTGINEVLPAGIERIIMTNKYVLLSSKVDLDKPESALYNYKIDLTEQADKSKKKP
ncbi:MAG: hypothetical protein ACXVCP_06265 [Bdellovibrio sp.]